MNLGDNMFLKNYIRIKVKGKNIERFIRRMMNNHIDLLDIKYIKNDTVLLKINYIDYEKILDIKTIYEVNIVDVYGINRVKKIINKYKLLLLTIFIGFIVLVIMTNIITSVEVIHTDGELRELIIDELYEYKVKPNHFKKSYDELDKIKKKILLDHKDKIEWLEIGNIGTKYIVRVEERKILKNKKDTKKVNIVAKKSAFIKDVYATNGVVLKEKNDYVNKGDVVISGEVYLNEELKNITSAAGKVYGEVWYKSVIEFPYFYHDLTYTGNNKTVYSIKFLNFTFDLFNFKPFKNHKDNDKVLLKSFLIPLKLVKSSQKEVIEKDKIYTISEAVIAAHKLGIKKQQEKLKEKEYIIAAKDLKVSTKNSKIRLDMFFTVYEDITDTIVIDEEKLLKKQESTKDK